jgi:two-component system chemotaxis response regulator CheB
VISVLVVDDSVVVRRLITDALADDPDIRVVGTAPNGRVALSKLDQLAPDLVTLDMEMPVMDGLETLREVRKLRPRLPVIMFSTLTAAGATATLDALAAGASDYVTKPSNTGSIAESIRSVREQLIPRIHALCRFVRPAARPATAPATGRPPTMPVATPPTRSGTGAASSLARPAGTPRWSERPDVLAIGC